MTDLYDELPYKSRAFAGTHVAALATMATLFGLSPADPRRCRVLEIGCASGGNLVPMALALPGSRFVGIDVNAAAIGRATARAARLGAENARFLAADVAALPAAPEPDGPFDFIVCHGVYSWVGPEVQDAILRLCAERLAPHGVAYVSYNAMPGWAWRSALRHMALFHAGGHPELDTRLAQTRALVDLVSRATPADHALRRVMDGERAHFVGMPDWYVVHEHLGAHNEALWFHEFIGRADRHGLQFLAEPELHEMVPLDLPPDVRADVEALGTDLLRTEQYLDFVRHRTFRRTLLCRAGLPLVRDIPLERAALLHVAGVVAARPSDPSAPAEPTTEPEAQADPVAAATWAAISEALPGSVGFSTLCRRVGRTVGRPADAVRADVAWQVLGGLARGALRASILPFPDAEPGERPLGYRVARDELAHGETWVTSRAHHGVQLDDYSAALLALLDGTRDREAVVAALAPRVASGELAILDLEHRPVESEARAAEVLREGWARALRSLRYYGLLEG